MWVVNILIMYKQLDMDKNSMETDPIVNWIRKGTPNVKVDLATNKREVGSGPIRN